MLVDVAAVMRKTIRKSDFGGRYGGDEFMVIFPNTDLAGAGQTSERIRQAVLSREFADGLKTQLSGGISQYGGETVTEFIHKADKRLYAAKNSGKNQIVTDWPKLRYQLCFFDATSINYRLYRGGLIKKTQYAN